MTEPTLWNRFVAKMSGEVSANTLESYRRASLAVYDALDHCEAHRDTARQEKKNAWTIASSTQAEFLCTWNAFVLQTLGDRFLDADYDGNPDTRGFVPPITADQILRFYVQVEEWLNRAQQAHHNPDYKLDVYVPAELPPWSEVEPCPNAHLFGMMEAMHAVRDHNERALAFLNESAPENEAQTKQLNSIRQLAAAAATKARYAEDMMSGNPTRDVHERVEEHVKKAIELYYLLGQTLAMPSLGALLLQPQAQPPVPAPQPIVTPRHAMPLPGENGFDPWCLTDPDSLTKFKADGEARKAIKVLWELDPEPRKTLGIKAEIDAAFKRGDLEFAVDRYGKKLGHFFCCPWGPVYIVKRPVIIDGQSLRVMQQFIFNVTCEGVNLGVPFERELMLGNFSPTTRFEYGDPNEPPDH